MKDLPRQRPLYGVLFLIAGAWTLSLLDATGKALTVAGLSVVLVSWARYAVHTLLLCLIVMPVRGRGMLRSRQPRFQLLRSLLMLATTLLFFSVLKLLPLAEATAINFCAPLFVIALSSWLLHEPFNRSRLIGVVIGFAGMLIVVRPGGGLNPQGVALGVLTAITFAAFQIATRRVASDDPLTTNFYGGLTGTVVLTLMLPFFPLDLDLTPLQWALLASTGVTGMAGHLLQISAYRYAPASLLSPFIYLQIISATVIGWLAFGQLPDAGTALGIAIICAAGIFVAVSEWRNRPPLASAR